MHVMQGCVSHFFQECRDGLRIIDVADYSSTWTNDRVIPTLEAVRKAKTQTPEYKTMHNAMKKHQSSIKKHTKLLKEEREKENPDQEKIMELTLIANLAESQKMEIINGDYGITTQLHQGLADLEKSIVNYLKRDCRSPRGEAEFTFNSAMKTLGCVSFRTEHSGLELAHRDNIKVLDAFVKISACVCTVYPDDDAKRERVVELMGKATDIVEPLLKLCRQLKGQDRIPPAAQVEIKRNLNDLFRNWKQHGFSHAPVFNKLHHLVHHVIGFIKEFEMYGRASEEGFEAAHPMIESTKDKTKSMTSNEQRIGVECRRIQALMNPRISEILKTLHPEIKRRGPYNKQAKRNLYHDATPVEYTAHREAPDGYFITRSGQLLRLEWKEVHEMCQHKHAPAAWTRAIDNIDGLSNAAKEKARFTK